MNGWQQDQENNKSGMREQQGQYPTRRGGGEMYNDNQILYSKSDSPNFDNSDNYDSYESGKLLPNLSQFEYEEETKYQQHQQQYTHFRFGNMMEIFPPRIPPIDELLSSTTIGPLKPDQVSEIGMKHKPISKKQSAQPQTLYDDHEQSTILLSPKSRQQRSRKTQIKAKKPQSSKRNRTTAAVEEEEEHQLSVGDSRLQTAPIPAHTSRQADDLLTPSSVKYQPIFDRYFKKKGGEVTTLAQNIRQFMSNCGSWLLNDEINPNSDGILGLKEDIWADISNEVPLNVKEKYSIELSLISSMYLSSSQWPELDQNRKSTAAATDTAIIIPDDDDSSSHHLHNPMHALLESDISRSSNNNNNYNMNASKQHGRGKKDKNCKTH